MYIQVKLGLVLALLMVTCKTHATATEYIFINIWDEYYQSTELPQPMGERIFVQPDINIDKPSLTQFVTANPIFKGIRIDHNNQLMYKFQVRATPTRVVVNEGRVILKEALIRSEPPEATSDTKVPLQTLSGTPLSKPLIYQQYQVLFFSDSLCPFQHIPDCEKRIEQNNQLAQHNKNVLTVIKPFYVDKQSALNYQQRFGVKHDIVFDTHNQLFEQYQINELPYWVLLDNKGKTLYRGTNVPR
ncbi:TlpA family protein disulfide reductase [Pseudoalteromonas luteoviolacea]|uniref:Thioredoxin domain-containing protein n=1 Tax=Pseudoalteromonas luteoviolacea S4054 TaxID=1129367 RepID=A0A0F6A959_9GAMM|nr:hypothetical protein [Pseudoalteromonas luteoviolacea]AOT10101.1 hypothetical protein S4054249_20805 [Pseudoalteromonas luteoviolacea]AOT15012.1 hypothetical protein S40542_20770 [Pseudoalteromonas luteoviolacea]AOT19928.1 hypothetical protein S4054_20775 [Pseudoalteromonas luteoviolacea]KKE82371.1 hypothetical protein N479_01975 [Pseudoalteromonas luteoviolacea S4054]KZN77997.1 hypothetical protein N481_03985 [Pseudoalteromonas luteoviolacea S4047-1]